jgi:hypothetical protein
MTFSVLLVLLLAAPHAAPPSSSFDDLVSDLAGRIAAALSRTESVHVVIAGDRSSEPAVGVLDISKQLAARGIQVVEAASGATIVRIGCSANLRERVCLAEIKRPDGSQVVAATGPLAREAGPVDPPLVLELRHVFSQPAQILDVAVVGDRLIVLDAASMTLYQRTGGTWQRRRSQAIASSRIWPRDLRGRVRVTGSSVEGFLPGAICRATLESFAVSCADDRQPWPLGIDNAGIASGRNYFTTPEGLGFYGFAPLEPGAGAKSLLVADRSRLVLLDEARRALDPAVGVGEDVVGVTACAPGSFVLVASRAPGGDSRDTLRLFRVVERRLMPAASSLLLSGTLTALWATAGSSTATAIVRDAAFPERYDALQIDVACGRP